ncbi:MAG: hypothetical protein R3C28_25315 [Pirellulaceae bacterium]
MSSATPLITPAFLFNVSANCHRFDGSWSRQGAELDVRHGIPSFRAELDNGPLFGDFRLAWSATGLWIDLRVSGKKQTPWCRETRLEDSDGLSIWLDTRNTQGVHRANRFCHRFAFLPQGAGRLLDEPCAKLVSIARAKEHPKPVADGELKVYSEKRIDGYLLRAFIPGEAITGYDPVEHSRIGFSYAVIDRELGWQSYTLGPEYPFTSDPTLWGSLALVD